MKLLPSTNATHNDNGSAVITYYDTYNTAKNPYCFVTYDSIMNEKLHARLFGATFNEHFDDIDSIFNYDLLGEGSYGLTYIEVKSIRVNNIPTIARTNIENAFLNGVDLYDYETTGE